MITISFVYQVDKTKLDVEYVIMFGNMESGWGCTAKELKEVWKKALKCSMSISYGDITLLRKGKLIRGVQNIQTPILQKRHNNPKYYDIHECKYNKYK